MVATERFDSVVVGAGPAGSTAAFRLARAGARVLLVDKARFPRDKPCGGGLTYRALRQLPFSVASVVEEEVDVFELGLGYRRRFMRRTAEPLVVMTQRRRLDAFLVEQAREAGAEFRHGAKVELSPLIVDGERVATKTLIGADGVNGMTARSLGLRDHEHEVALEANVPYGAVNRTRYARRAVVEFGIVPGGYGWVFPKGDHVNVGVGGWQEEGPRLRAHLARLCREHRIPVDAMTDIRGYRLPLRRPGALAAHGRTALVGDAAGLVDPVSGDGIYEAFLSAKLAAAAALDVVAGRAADFRGYAVDLQKTLGLSTAASWRAKLALERFPRLSFALLQAPQAWRALEQLMRADATHPAAIGGPGGAALRAAELLARLAGDPGRAFATGS
ncbi:MAG TPA: geranylgeranyl reductase family protein [Gaiellaceae bacterium]|nr:geranylgeranyl reductase family protein [Gaiellaceae bacterium]